MSKELPAAAPGLLRALGPWTATAVVVGTVIGSGVFKKPQLVAENVPFFGMAALVWVLGGLLAFLGSLAYAEIVVLYPKAGGNYVFLREGYGRLAAFLWGWVEFWIIRGASLAALATIFSESLWDVLRNPAIHHVLGLDSAALPSLLSPASSTDLAGNEMRFWAQRGMTVCVILGLGLVNVRGVRWGGLLQLFITTVKVASLLGIMVLPVIAVFVAASGGAMPAPRGEYLAPAWPSAFGQFNLAGLGSALVGVLFAYHGWMNIAPIAEEVKEPNRNLPRSLLLGTAIVITLYLGANLAYALTIPRPEMAALRDTTVATEFALRLLGPIGAAIASAAVMCSVFGALNGNLLVGPRLLYAMGEDGLAPRALGTVHAHYRTPAIAILLMAGWGSLLVLAAAALTRYQLPLFHVGSLAIDLNVPANKALFDLLTDFAMFGAISFETLSVTTIFIFRWRYPQAERPYRCIGYPIVPALYVIIMATVLVSMFYSQRTESLVGLGFIAVGAGVYLWVDRARKG